MLVYTYVVHLLMFWLLAWLCSLTVNAQWLVHNGQCKCDSSRIEFWLLKVIDRTATLLQ